MRPNPTYCPIKVPRRHVRYAETFVRATLYVSPYLVATPKGYTKHYYAESERVASRTGAGMDSVNLFLSNLAAYRESSVSLNNPLWQESWTTEEVFLAKYDTIEWQLDHVVYECLWTYPNVVFDSLNILYSYANLSPYQHENEPDCYWYHPDHLGSSSWITYTDGSAVQHLHYLPWGEDFVDQRSTNWNAMYTFSAKEKDTETGYSYFGSRYYSSDLSIWLSVDPMSDKYPNLSPYTYCADNPIKLVDPNGEEFSNPDDPPKRNFFQKIGDGFVKFDKSLEGHSDGANQGTITKQDVEVGVAVAATMMSAGAALEAETAFKTTVAIASAANSVDDATVNSSGQTVSQKAAANNKTASTTVKVGKTLVSAASVGVSANDVRKVVVEATKKGTQVIKKKASTIAKNVASAATSVYGAVTSLFKKKK